MNTVRSLYRRLAVAFSAATVIVATIALAPQATAADNFGPGYTVPDSTGALPSHMGEYGAPGEPVPGVSQLTLCADPPRIGPALSGGYGPVRTVTTWRTAAGTPVPAEDVRAAAFIAAQYAGTTSDVQAAAADAALTSVLNPGTTYALPAGSRALQRLHAPGVPAAVATEAEEMLANARDYPGPYTLRIQPHGTLQPGHKTYVSIQLAAANGKGVPGATVRFTGTEGSTTQTLTTSSTDGGGSALSFVVPPSVGAVTLSAQAGDLPALTLRTVSPANPAAQRLILPGTHSTAQTQITLQAAPASGRLQIIKTDARTHRPLAGVEFVVKTTAGATAATGRTGPGGTWLTPALPPGTYLLHEQQAAAGYTVAADRRVTLAASSTTTVHVTDTRIPAVPKPTPTPSAPLPPGTLLPRTGA